MKKKSINTSIVMFFSVLFIHFCLQGCKKSDNPIKYKQGTFPDSVINISGINSQFDDYNLNINTFTDNIPIIFSSNRNSSGGQFDVLQAVITFTFSQETGEFTLESEMTNDSFYSKLLDKVNTSGNDLGPYRLYSSYDGLEYTFISSENAEGNLDIFYLKNIPTSISGSLPNIDGPYPAKILNTGFNDAYISFDSSQDSIYFTSNPDGNFDIFMRSRPSDTEISTWLNGDYTFPIKVDSINSTSDDKCPIIFRKVMIFASNRPGGMGGFDLYYSLFKNKKWNSPVNMGPGINSSSDEYRPVAGYHADFTNSFLMFSSNRSGGKGSFDLFFTGIEFPD